MTRPPRAVVPALTSLRSRVWQGQPVPALAAWSGQQEVTRRYLRRCPTGLYYTTERPADRMWGVLVSREMGEPGEGEPRWSSVSSPAQRALMRHELCRGCAGRPSRTPAGALYLLHGQTTVREGEVTGQPPVCLPCAGLLLKRQPRMVRYAAVRAQHTLLWGVTGTRYLPKGRALEPFRSEETLPFGDTGLHELVAAHLLRTLCRITPITPERLRMQIRNAAPLERGDAR